MDDPDLVECELSRLVLQQKGESQMIQLRVLGEQRVFPIVIGFYEAAEIHRKLTGDQFERPMTHDLIGRILDSTGWNLSRVVVNALTGGTFYARLDLDQDGELRRIDCRPSDAICLALQKRAPVFVARQVLDEVAAEG